MSLVMEQPAVDAVEAKAKKYPSQRQIRPEI